MFLFIFWAIVVQIFKPYKAAKGNNLQSVNAILMAMFLLNYIILLYAYEKVEKAF